MKKIIFTLLILFSFISFVKASVGVIFSSKLFLEEKLIYLEKYVPEIYDWSGCDIVISTFKCSSWCS